MSEDYGQGLYNEGTFYFTNPTGEQFVARWNNVDYVFDAKSTVPLIIANEPPENIQEIRKKFAKKLALQVFHQSKRYKELVKAGGYVPATYDDDTELGAIIQSCLTPLPKSLATVKQVAPEPDSNYRATKAVRKGQNLEKLFEDQEVEELGVMTP